MSGKSYREWKLDCKVYIGNLSDGASKVDIESAFSKYGPLRNVWVARNPPGFAFVEYEDPRDAEDAVRGLDGTRIAGARVRVEMSHGRTRRGGYHSGRRGGNYRSRSPRIKRSSRYSRSRSRSLTRRSRSRSLTRSRSPRSPPPRSPRSPPPRGARTPPSRSRSRSPTPVRDRR